MNKSAFAFMTLLLLGASWAVADQKRRFSGPSMALPDELKNDVSIVAFAKVQTFRNPMSFPPFAVRSLKRGWTRSDQDSIGSRKISVDATRARENYSFVLTEDGDNIYSAKCHWTAQAEGIKRTGKTSTLSVGLGESSQLDCDLTRMADQAKWSLSLEVSNDSSNGSLTDGTTSYRVATVYKVEGFKLTGTEPSGYLISTEENAIAAAETIANGRLILRSDVTPEQRSLFAATTAALMLQQKVSDVD